MSTKVVTGRVRLSFPHLFEPYAFETEEPRYSVMLLIPKSDKKTLKDIKRAIEAAKERGKANTWGGRMPSDIQITLKDGDDTADEFPEREGHMFMTVRTKTKPGVVDRALNPIIDPSEVYSGCYARVSINAFAYKFGGNTGVSFGLGNVQKVDEGESLGGATRAEEDFSALDEDEDDDDLI